MAVVGLGCGPVKMPEGPPPEYEAPRPPPAPPSAASPTSSGSAPASALPPDEDELGEHG